MINCLRLLPLLMALAFLGPALAYAQALPEKSVTAKTVPDPSPKTLTPQQKAAMIKKIPKQVYDQYVQESIDVFHECQSTITMAENFDCECLAARFLEVRIEKGPSLSRQNIYMNLGRECRDTTGGAGMAYKNCLTGAYRMKKGMDPEKICSCVGRTYAKLMDRDKPIISMYSVIQYQEYAQTMCSSPETAAKLGYGSFDPNVGGTVDTRTITPPPAH